MSNNHFPLPDEVQDLWIAKERLRQRFNEKIRETGSAVDLEFTLDGNLVGDVGEALAVEMFGIRLTASRSTEGVDGFAPDGRSVQVKATGKRRGPAFRMLEVKADHFLFLDLDFANGKGCVLFNGPERLATQSLPKYWMGQRSVPLPKLLKADLQVPKELRLQRVYV